MGSHRLACMTRSHGIFFPTPVGFHPTDEDVVFVALPDAVFAYSIKHGTMSPGCTTHGCLLPIVSDVYPYVHPAYPVQIPAIKDRNLRSKRGCFVTHVIGGVEQRKRLKRSSLSIGLLSSKLVLFMPPYKLEYMYTSICLFFTFSFWSRLEELFYYISLCTTFIDM
jgi:hypothetical protein